MTNEVENLRNAKLKHKSGKIEEAIKIYQKLIIKEKNNPEIFFLTLKCLICLFLDLDETITLHLLQLSFQPSF